MQLHLLIALSKGRHAKCHTAISKMVSAEHILLMLEITSESTSHNSHGRNKANIASLYCALLQARDTFREVHRKAVEDELTKVKRLEGLRVTGSPSWPRTSSKVLKR